MKHKLVIFDFDGTLADTFPWFVHVFDEAADRYQFKRLDRKKLNGFRHFDARRLVSHHQIPVWKLPLITRYMRARMEEDISGIHLFSGIDDALRALSKEGVILAIASSNSQANVQQVLGAEISALFNYIECGASLFGKHAKLRKVLVRSQVKLKDAILIGDEIRDAEAAMNAGISFGAVAWGYNNIESLISHQPQKVFFSAEELYQKLMS